MKNLIYIGSLLLAFVIVGCEEDLKTEGSSRIIYYPTFVIEGDEVVHTVPGSFTGLSILVRVFLVDTLCRATIAITCVPLKPILRGICWNKHKSR